MYNQRKENLMKKRVVFLSGMLLIAMLMSTTALARDGSTSCTFKGTGNSDGIGHLVVDSSRIVATSSLTGENVRAVINYQYVDSSGQARLGTPENRRMGAVTVEVSLPSGTSDRKARSNHQVVGNPSLGACSLW